LRSAQSSSTGRWNWGACPLLAALLAVLLIPCCHLLCSSSGHSFLRRTDLAILKTSVHTGLSTGEPGTKSTNLAYFWSCRNLTLYLKDDAYLKYCNPHYFSTPTLQEPVWRKVWMGLGCCHFAACPISWHFKTANSSSPPVLSSSFGAMGQIHPERGRLPSSQCPIMDRKAPTVVESGKFSFQIPQIPTCLLWLTNKRLRTPLGGVMYISPQGLSRSQGHWATRNFSDWRRVPGGT
jgi:hypothetical protein